MTGKRSSRAKLAALALLGSLAASGGALAQSAVNRLPGVIDRPTPQVNLPPLPRPLPPLVGAPTPQTVPDANAPIPTITRVEFSGNTVESTARLQKVVAPYLNRKLTRGDLAQLKYDITRLYYADGYILVRVVTPPQDLAKGNLQITIYEAKIEKIDNKQGHRAPSSSSTASPRRSPPARSSTRSEVESMVRDIDDLPGVAAAVDLRPGSQLGTTDLDLALKQTKDFQQSVSVNNYGSKLTGEWLFNGNFQYGNLLGLGERYVLNVTGSNDSLFTIQGGIQTPIGLRNVILDTSYLFSNSDIGNAFATLGTERPDQRLQDRALERAAEYGQAEVHGAGRVRCPPSGLDDPERKHHPIVRHDSRILHRRHLSAAAAGHDVAHRSAARPGLRMPGFQHPGQPGGQRGQWRSGGHHLPRHLVRAPESVEADGSIKGLLTGQYAGDTLLASDLFSIGGYGSVRGFQPAQSTGNSGLQTSIELDQDGLAQWDVEHRRRALVRRRLGLEQRPRRCRRQLALQRRARGRAAYGLITTLGDTSVRFDWAHPVGTYKDTNVGPDTFYVQLLQTF